ncbi:unnamed protein product [Caenorhabditis sp. 36 PRJEB53466]|nr:unnamed protein product [Caenorhabditis sp. 36 PRJEB53466]
MMTNFEIVTCKKESTTRRNRLSSHEDEDEEHSDGMGMTQLWSENDDDVLSTGDGGKEGTDRHSRTRQRYHYYDKGSPFYCHPEIKAGDKIPIPQCRLKFMRKVKQKLGRFHMTPMGKPGSERTDEYFRRLVIVFVPWRVEDVILNRYGVDTYEKVWQKYLKELKQKHPLA